MQFAVSNRWCVIGRRPGDDRVAGLSIGQGRCGSHAEAAAANFLTVLGVSLDNEGMRDTPRRLAGAYREMLTPRPFIGVASVGYLPGDRIIGWSKLARVVEMFARRPQVQERLTKQVADWLQTNLQPRGVGVVIEVEHLRMTLRGVRSSDAVTTTSAIHGLIRNDPRSRTEFFSLTGMGGVA